MKRTRLVAGVLSAMVLIAPLAMASVPSLTFTNLRGTLHVVQSVPCGGVVDATTSIADGRMEVTPSALRGDVIGGGVLFDLNRLELFFTPFTVQHACLGVTATADFREIGVQLASAVKFTGEAVGGPEDRRYRFSIPKEQVLIFESVLDNLPVPQPETAYQRPSEDITGEIDLRRRTAELHIALASRLRFRVGCIGNHCLIDEEGVGRQTADVGGTLVNPGTDTDGDRVPDLTDNCPLVPNPDQSPVATPRLTAPADVTLASCAAHDISIATASDVCHARPVVITNNAPARFAIGRNVVTWQASDGIDPPVTAPQVVTIEAVDRTPPTVSCRAADPPGVKPAADPPGSRFTVAAADDCAGPTTLKLGAFALTNGEVIQIQETGKPGVRLINTIGDGSVRHFQVGKGEALIVATDAAGNVARAACGVPLDITTEISKKK